MVSDHFEVKWLDDDAAAEDREEHLVCLIESMNLEVHEVGGIEMIIHVCELAVPLMVETLHQLQH